MSKSEGITVLSLFDGMSCGQLALQRLGIKVKKYFASEIDKYAIKVTQHNFPNTIQLGDVRNVFAKDLPKIDLLLAGSPCQGFSIAGKGLAFEDPRSKLFFEFVRLKNECNPTYFLLENVRMKKEYELIISKYVGVQPIMINSALLSAQNRVRLYWTNIANESYGLFGDVICTIPQPKDKGILLRDILESDVPQKYYLNEKMAECLTRHSEKRGRKWVISDSYQKTYSLNSSGGFSLKLENNYVCLASDLQIPDKSHCIDANYSKGSSIEYYIKKKRRQLIINHEGNLVRRLTPTECERLQTVPDGYTKCVSDTQRYKMLGNGWTVDVIAYILSFMNFNIF